jgi:hypothetical protein
VSRPCRAGPQRWCGRADQLVSSTSRASSSACRYRQRRARAPGPPWWPTQDRAGFWSQGQAGAGQRLVVWDLGSWLGNAWGAASTRWRSWPPAATRAVIAPRRATRSTRISSTWPHGSGGVEATPDRVAPAAASASMDAAGLVGDRSHLAVGLGVDPTVTVAVGWHAGHGGPFRLDRTAMAPTCRDGRQHRDRALPRLLSGHSPDRWCLVASADRPTGQQQATWLGSSRARPTGRGTPTASSQQEASRPVVRHEVGGRRCGSCSRGRCRRAAPTSGAGGPGRVGA